MTPTKKCSKCCTEKPRSEFYKTPQNRDGYFTRCKTCVKIQQLAWSKTDDGRASALKFREENRDKMKAYYAAYDRSEKGKEARKKYRASEKGKEAKKRYRKGKGYAALKVLKKKAARRRAKEKYQQDPEFRRKFKARVAPGKDDPIKRSARKKAYKAVKSGKILRVPCPCGNPNSQAHHEDYSKPLGVVFLCASCHMKRHYELQLLDLNSY